ncbi:MAG: aminotransferase class I/II-fold pyridoxal phosphate-dependent enzyme, partial [Polyangiaceae bacterium]
LEDGDVQRHVRRARRVYEGRRDVLVNALGTTFGERLSFEPPPGGTALWAKVDSSIDVDAWSERALTCGVSFQAARYFTFDGRSRNFVRFGFAQLDEKELLEAVRRLARALP